jgi:hypothetical protein
LDPIKHNPKHPIPFRSSDKRSTIEFPVRYSERFSLEKSWCGCLTYLVMILTGIGFWLGVYALGVWLWGLISKG